MLLAQHGIVRLCLPFSNTSRLRRRYCRARRAARVSSCWHLRFAENLRRAFLRLRETMAHSVLQNCISGGKWLKEQNPVVSSEERPRTHRSVYNSASVSQSSYEQTVKYNSSKLGSILMVNYYIAELLKVFMFNSWLGITTSFGFHWVFGLGWVFCFVFLLGCNFGAF